jgi:hypothetical protein
VLTTFLSKTTWENAKASFYDPDCESFALADKFLRRISVNEFT